MNKLGEQERRQSTLVSKQYNKDQRVTFTSGQNRALTFSMGLLLKMAWFSEQASPKIPPNTS